ncbi:hypothetical protein [Sedimentitalea sp.]|uniref:hypothetical protein n=1 Tax=Sedimentitalea sp. TaxID=2048915 RepID=UPI003296F1DD
MSFNDIDYWRLSDVLSVTDAAMLGADINPGEWEATWPSNPQDGHFHKRGTGNHTNNYFDSPKFIAVFSAIRNAILADTLPANLAKRTRAAPYHWYDGMAVEMPPEDDEDGISYEALLKLGGGSFRTNAHDTDFGTYQTLLFLKEPDWSQSTVAVDDLKDWMKKKNFLPPFFFPAGSTEGFRNREHPRYSPKLACAAAAWEAVTRHDVIAAVALPGRTRSGMLASQEIYRGEQPWIIMPVWMCH